MTAGARLGLLFGKDEEVKGNVEEEVDNGILTVGSGMFTTRIVDWLA